MEDVVPVARLAQTAGHLVWFHFVLPCHVQLLRGPE
jgi:hypothetical protein